MTSKFFEFLEQLMIDTFLMKLTQFEKKNESMGKIFIPLGIQINKVYFKN